MTSPTREDITRRAQELWRKRHCPVGQDNQIWLEAERQLVAGADEEAGTTPDIDPADPLTSASAAEEHLASPLSEDASLKAGMQKTAARQPIVPTKFAPVPSVPKSGKPLWAHTHAF